MDWDRNVGEEPQHLSVEFSRKDVSWIKSAGIAQHPEWYPGTFGMNYFQFWSTFDITIDISGACI